MAGGALGPVVGVEAGAGCFMALGATVLLISLAILVSMFRDLRDLRSLRLDEEGITTRERRISWADIESVAIQPGRLGGAIRLETGAGAIRIKPHLSPRCVEILGMLRAHCPGYRLSLSEEASLRHGTIVRRRRKGPSRSRAELDTLYTEAREDQPGATYRAAPGVWCAVPSLCGLLLALSRRRLVRLEVGIAASIFVSAAVVDTAVIGLGLTNRFATLLGGLAWSVLLMSPVALILGGLAVVGLVSYQLGVRRFLGPVLRERAAGVWESPEGHRRFRQTAADEGDPWLGHGHYHLEELDEDGSTARSFKWALPASSLGATFDLVDAPAEARAAWRAAVEPSAWSPRCFEGSPCESPTAHYGEPRHLLVERLEDGWLLTRFDEHLGYAGDTWHETRAHAGRQVEVELGVTPEWERVDPELSGHARLVG